MLHDAQIGAVSIQVGSLFIHGWFEAQVASALTEAGLSLTAFHDPMAFATGLRDRPVEIALIEDHEKNFLTSMNTLRFRGAVGVPVLAVGRGSADEIRSALLCGATDYAVMGESMQTLVNRVLARLSNSRQSQPQSILRAGDCWLERSSRSMQHPNGETQLTPREFALAWVLFEQAGQVVGMAALSQQVWGRDPSIAKRTIEQHVSRLRAKLLAACRGADRQVSLQAVQNVGYRLVIGSTPISLPASVPFHLPIAVAVAAGIHRLAEATAAERRRLSAGMAEAACLVTI